MTEHTVYLRRARRNFASELPAPVVGPPGPPGRDGADGKDGRDGVTRTVVIHAGGGSSGGSGGGLIATTTISGLQSLASAGSLVPGGFYAVTDWQAPPNLPGPNVIIVQALDAGTLSGLVQVKTPLGANGPVCGEFNWPLGNNGMVALRDGLGNEFITQGGIGFMGAWPWGNPNVFDNRVVDGRLLGMTLSNGTVSNNEWFTGTIDVTGSASVNITNNILQGVFITASDSGSGNGVTFQACSLLGTFMNAPSMQGVTFIQVDDTTSAYGGIGSITVQNNVIANSSVFCRAADPSLVVQNSTLTSATISQALGTRRSLIVDSCTIGAATINYTRTAPFGIDKIVACDMPSGTLTWAGSDPPGLGQTLRGVSLGSLALTVTDPAHVAVPVLDVTVQGGATLNVQAGGAVSCVRVAGGGTLNTGAFTHTAVTLEDNGTTTLTANNTNTMKTPLGSNVI